MGGEVIISQKEMIQYVFLPLVIDEDFSSVESKYLISAMIEFHRSLIEAEIPAEIATQILCIKFLIQKKEYLCLQMLLQYQSFGDSPELADCLLQAVDSGCALAFQLVLDMYHRMKRYREAIRILLASNRVQEAVTYVEKFRLKGFPAKEILEAAHRLPEKQLHVYLDYFSKANVIIIC